MRTNWCSSNRCEQITCEHCARRYACRITRRLLTKATGSLRVIEIDITASQYTDFWAWRVEARNLVDYRRRENRWWAGFIIAVWWSADRSVRGVVSLGSLTASEVLSAFDARWRTGIRPIEPTDLRREISAFIDPGVIALSPSPHGRYQALKLSIWPQRSRTKTPPVRGEHLPTLNIEPMPILI